MSALTVQQVSVRFGGVHALSEVDLDVAPGAVTGLIGPNGAGKTTLFNVICGLQAPTVGRVLLGGTDISGTKPHQRARLGLGRTFQRLEVFGSLTVRDNVRVAAEVHKSWSSSAPDPDALADEVLARIGLGSLASARVDALPTGSARLVELARALAAQPKVLLLDEPSSGLDEDESDAFAELLLDLAVGGLAILLVEHDVDLVMRVCSLVHVLDFGKILAVGSPAVIRSDPVVQRAYLGTMAVPEPG